MEGEWSFYRGAHFNGGGVVLKEVTSLKEAEWSCYRGYFNGGRNVMSEVVTLMEGE